MMLVQGKETAWQPTMDVAHRIEDGPVSTSPLDRVSLEARFDEFMPMFPPPCKHSGAMSRLAPIQLDWSDKVLVLNKGEVAIRAKARCMCSTCGDQQDFFLFEKHTAVQLAAEKDW